MTTISNHLAAAGFVPDGIEDIKLRLQRGGYASADDYAADKDLLRHLVADRLGKKQTEIDPAGFWFGRQS